MSANGNSIIIFDSDTLPTGSTTLSKLKFTIYIYIYIYIKNHEH